MRYIMFMEDITKWVDDASPIGVVNLNIHKIKCHLTDCSTDVKTRSKRRATNREDGGASPPAAVSKLFRSVHFAYIFRMRHYKP